MGFRPVEGGTRSARLVVQTPKIPLTWDAVYREPHLPGQALFRSFFLTLSCFMDLSDLIQDLIFGFQSSLVVGRSILRSFNDARTVTLKRQPMRQIVGFWPSDRAKS